MNFKELLKHLKQHHQMNNGDVISVVEAYDGDIDLFHTEEHADTNKAFEHTHDVATGNVVTENLTLANGKTITMTDDGWALNGSAADIFLDLNNLIVNRGAVFNCSYNETEQKLSGALMSSSLGVRITKNGDNLLDLVRVLLGEGYKMIVGIQ